MTPLEALRRRGPFLAALVASLGLHWMALALIGLERDATTEPPPRSHEVRFLPAADAEGEPPPEAPRTAADARASGRSEQDRAAGGPQADPRRQPEEPSSPSTGSDSPGRTPSDSGTREAAELASQTPSRLTGPDGEPVAAEDAPATEEAQRSLALFPSARETARWRPEQQRAQAAADELRHHRVRPDTRADTLAAYVAAWLGKVERVGNMNYPEEARRRGLTGAVRVEAVLRPDGSLASVEIIESSGTPVLDRAAERIIRLGAPYSAFGAKLRQRVDRLHIPHRFVFSRGAQLDAGVPGD